MRDGSVRNRSGDPYKPSVVKCYDQLLHRHVLPALAARRLGDVSRNDVQRLVDQMQRAGFDPSTIRNAVMPLRVIYRRAIRQDHVATSPLAHVDLPRVAGRRTRIAPPAEAATRLNLLESTDRAPWALAFYAGLRLGEVLALRWSDIDLDHGELRVERAWCKHTHTVTAPKSSAGNRTVPIPAALSGILHDHRHSTQRRGVADLVYPSLAGGIASAQFTRRASRVWKHAELGPLTFHEARHTYASLMLAAGVNLTDLSEFMGHASITITNDRYGHLLPDARQTAAHKLDQLLGQATAA